MAVTPLSQAIMQGMDPNVYRPLSDIQQGDALLASGMDASPTTKWGALGRLAQSLAGSYLSNSATSDLAKTIAGGKKQAQADLLAALNRSSVPTAAPQSAPPRSMAPVVQAQTAQQQTAAAAPSGAPEPYDPATFAAIAEKQANRAFEPAIPLGTPAAAAATPAAGHDYGSAISKIESGGKYDLLGPVTRTGDRAYGKYQVMGANIPEWTKAILGKAMTPQEFLASPDAQEAVFKGKFGEYAQKYGPEGAAKAWFAGEKGMHNPNAKDQLGTSVQAYADKFMSGLGEQPGPQAIDAATSGTTAPVQMAQATPTVANDGSNLDVHKLLAVMQNPYADDATKAIVGKLLIQQLTPKEDEFASSPQGIYNKRTGELKQGQNAGADTGGLQGRDLLTSLEKSDPATAAQVKGIIEGRLAYPTGSRLNPVQQRIKELVTLVDPTFETGNSGARMKVRNEFLAGGPNTPAGQITAGNTAIQHLATLAKASKKIGGVNNAWILNGPLNKANAAVESMKNDPNLVEYNNALGRFAEEATKFYRGIGGNESDIQRAIADLGPGQSPEAREAAIKAQAELMHGKINSLQDRWRQGMGPLVDEFPIIQPKSKAAMDIINGKDPTGEAAPETATPAAASAAPKQVSSKAEYDALKPGTQYVAPDGSVRTKK